MIPARATQSIETTNTIAGAEMGVQTNNESEGHSNSPLNTTVPVSRTAKVLRQCLPVAIWLILLGVGLYLRMVNLGELNLWGDEDITALAVKGIVADGYPRFPSGMVYFRSMLTSYVTAGFVAFGGLNEFTLRLPSVLFSLATIVVTFLLGRELFSLRTGYTAAFLLTLSFWDIEFARHARMYSAFACLFTFSLLAIYRGVFLGKRPWFWYSIVSSSLAVLTHLLGGSLALVYLAALPRVNLAKPEVKRVLGAAFMLMLLAVTHFALIQYGFQISARLHQLAEAASMRETFATLWQPMTAAMSHEFPQRWSYLIWTPMMATLTLSYFRNVSKQRTKALPWLLPVVAMVSLALQYVIPAIILLWVYLLFRGEGTFSFRRPEVRATLLLVLLAVVIKGGFVLLHVNLAEARFEAVLIALRAGIKEICTFPKLYYAGLLRAFPLTALIVSAGILWLWQQSQRSRNGLPAYFAIAAFTLPILANGLVKPGWVEYRLNFHLYPLFVTIYGGLIWELLAQIGKFRFRQLRFQACTSAVLAVIFLFAALELVSPRRAAAVVNRRCGDQLDPTTAPASHLQVMPDHRGPGEFVRQQRVQGELVVAMDWLAQSYYCGSLNFWLRSDYYEEQSYKIKHEYFDVYTGTKVVSTAAELADLINSRNRRGLWIISASPYYETGMHVSNEILAYLEQQQDRIVYRGRDQKSIVYYFPSDG